MRRSRRIEFEPELSAILSGRSRRFRKRPAYSRWVLGLLVLGGIAAALVFWRHLPIPTLFGPDPETKALAQVSQLFWTALQSNNLPAAADLFAPGAGSSPGGSDAPASSTASLDARQSLLQTLQMVRDDLAKAGMDWALAQPVAFAGVHARALEAGVEGQATLVTIGELYIRSAGGLFVVEFSTRHIGGACQIADLWHWGKSDQDPSTLPALPESKKQEFLSENADTTGEKVRFSDIESIYIPFK